VDVVLFPDAEQVLCQWLAAALAAKGVTVPVVTSVPSKRPAMFVRLMRTGGARHSVVTDAALITVESFAARESAASSLAQMCRAVLNAAPGNVAAVTVYKVREIGGPQNLPDPVTTQYRYTQTFEVHLRGAAA
jgi:hypothetical protein